MKNFYWALVLVFAACSPQYGRQACKTTAECGSSQTCDICNTARDAGAGTSVSGLCVLKCTTAADCSSLGLKKPACAKTTCGDSVCIDSPF